MATYDYYELIDNVKNHRKFWQVSIQGNMYVVKYGRIGTEGQTQIKTFANKYEAQRAANVKAHQKMKKGYTWIKQIDDTGFITGTEGIPQPMPTEQPTVLPKKKKKRNIEIDW